jgi:hypothetical protein
MALDAKYVPAEIKREVGLLLAKLAVLDWEIQNAYYSAESFGNWFVDLTKGKERISLYKDRSQYGINDDDEEFKAPGLFRVFNDLDEFAHAIIEWALVRDLA